MTRRSPRRAAALATAPLLGAAAVARGAAGEPDLRSPPALGRRDGGRHRPVADGMGGTVAGDGPVPSRASGGLGDVFPEAHDDAPRVEPSGLVGERARRPRRPGAPPAHRPVDARRRGRGSR